MLARKIRGLVNLNLPSSFVKGNEQLVVTSNSCFSPSSNESSVRPPVKFPIEFHREIEECNWKSNLSPHPRSHSPLKCWEMNRLTCSPFDPWAVRLLFKKKKKKMILFFFFFKTSCLFVFCSTRYLLFIRVTFYRCEFFFFFYLKRCWQILFSFFFFYLLATINLSCFIRNCIFFFSNILLFLFALFDRKLDKNFDNCSDLCKFISILIILVENRNISIFSMATKNLK